MLGGSDCNFQIELRESLNLDSCQMRIDNVSAINSFWTVDGVDNKYCYFLDGSTADKLISEPAPTLEEVDLLDEPRLLAVMVPPSAYTGADMAQTLASLSGQTVTYDAGQNSIDVTAGPITRIETDDELAQTPATHFPAAASPDLLRTAT